MKIMTYMSLTNDAITIACCLKMFLQMSQDNSGGCSPGKCAKSLHF